MRVPAFVCSASLSVAASLLAVACSPHESHAIAPPTEEQALAAQSFMKTTLEPAAEDVWDSVGYIVDFEGEHDLSPKTDQEWNDVVGDIDTLEIVLAGLKTAPFAWDEATWGGYVDQVVVAVEQNRSAAVAHDVDAMFEAGEVLDQACESCHLHFEEGENAGAEPAL